VIYIAIMHGEQKVKKKKHQPTLLPQYDKPIYISSLIHKVFQTYFNITPLVYCLVPYVISSDEVFELNFCQPFLHRLFLLPWYILYPPCLALNRVLVNQKFTSTFGYATIWHKALTQSKYIWKNRWQFLRTIGTCKVKMWSSPCTRHESL
jgi:hypothetical protein